MMKAKFMKGIVLGSMIGVGAGAVISNNMSRGTKRKIKKYANKMKHTACDLYGDCKDKMR